MILILFIIFLLSCPNNEYPVPEKRLSVDTRDHSENPYLIVLGTVQDGGSPHIGCQKQCCANLFTHPDPKRKVVSLGLIDPQSNKRFLIESTPDLPEQMHVLNTQTGSVKAVDGIFLTHAHIGHYSGLMYLGKEAAGAHRIPVYTMPRMKTFLETNGPWSQLVSQENIVLHQLENEHPVQITEQVRITPFLVPHRDEFSETVGYRIQGPDKRVLFIPDIDKWEKWEKSIIDEIREVDYAFIDGTFYDAAEIDYRDISQIPHPFITESMELFKELTASERQKIHFIHMNHTNPALDEMSEASMSIQRNGYRIARMGDVIQL